MEPYVRKISVMLLLWMQRARAFSFNAKLSVHYTRPLLQKSALYSTVSRSTSSKRTTNGKPSEASKDVLPSILLKRSRQSKSFRNGNQLVFTKAIQRVESGDELQVGQVVQVKVMGEKDQQPMLLGWGVYNPNSLYRVRILCHRFLLQTQEFKKMSSAISNLHSEPLDNRESGALDIILRHQLRNAWKTREALQLIPEDASSLQSPETDTFRLLNGEGDKLSGLSADIIGGNTIVIMSSAAWCEVHKSTIMSSLESILPCPMNLVWKTTPSRLAQDGFKTMSSEIDVPTNSEDENKMVVSLENSVKFKTFPFADGQKTGVYCDQRENRLNLAQYCDDKRVLDLCCYHGGFSLNAVLQGNAYHSTGVDSSKEAIDICSENAKLNQIPKDKITFLRSDIADFMRQRAEICEKDLDNEHYYDVVVLDPPKLAPSASALEKARRKYHSLNRDAIKLINPHEGGILMTCTCSAAMSQESGGQYFLQMVQGAAMAAGRDVTLLKVSGAAPCHTQSPICWPAGAYLTAALFRVHPI